MTAPLLGRDAELVAVQALLETARAGHGVLLLVSGEPGIGKTSLADAAAAGAADRDMPAVWGRCWDGADAPPHWLWTQVLRALGARGVELPADDAPRAAAAVARALREAGRDRPLLVLLEDLHNGTPEGIRVLPALVESVRDVPVALLATFRTGGARAPEVRETLQALAAAHPHRRLGGLEPADLHALLARHGTRMPAHRAARLHAASAGNPLLATMLARARGEPDGEEPLGDAPPEELRAHVRRQVDALPPETRAVLEVVTVLARTTTVEDVAAIAGLDPAAVRSRLAPAIEDLLVAEEDGLLRLRHEVVRLCLYFDLPLAARMALHGAAADALRARRGDDPGTRAEIAHHAFHAATGAEDPGALLAGVLAGARDARAASAPAEAASLLGHALSCAEAAGAPAATRVGIMLDLGDAQQRAGRHASAERSWRTATALARLSDDRHLIARAAVGSTRTPLLLGLATPAHVRALEEALAALGEERSPLRAQVLGLLSIALHRTHERLRGRDLAEEAVRVAEAGTDPGAQAVALLALHQVTRGAEAERPRPSVAAAAARHADEAGDDDLSVLARSLLVVDHRERGDAPAATAAILALREFAARRRHPVGRWAADVHTLVSALLDGDEEREAALAPALERTSRQNRDIAALTDFATAMTRLGPLEEVLRARVRSRARRLPEVLSWRGRALLDLAERGDPAAGDELPAVLATLGARARTNAHWLMASALTAEAVGLLGDAEAARTLLRALEPHADALVVTGRVGACRGSVRHHLGLLALTAGDAPGAVVHLREAARVHARPGFAAHRQRTMALLHRAQALARTAAPLALVREGAYWTLRGGDRVVTLPDLKGMRYLARLVAVPHTEVTALELFGTPAPGGAGPARDGLHADAGGSDAVLDAEAKRAFRQQLRRLAEERARAELLRDDERVAALDRERAEIEAALARGVGLGGRDRRLPSERERARTSVTKALRTAVERIREADPGVAAHLDASLRTGARCSYAPDGPPQLTS